jgi:hypothetical protein
MLFFCATMRNDDNFYLESAQENLTKSNLQKLVHQQLKSWQCFDSIRKAVLICLVDDSGRNDGMAVLRSRLLLLRVNVHLQKTGKEGADVIKISLGRNLLNLYRI